MAQVIEVEELKQMMANFLTQSDVPYKKIPEEINNKVRSMLATDRLRCTKRTQLVSRKSSVTQQDNQKKFSAAMVTPFPRNQGNQIPTEIYKQVKLWYKIKTMDPDLRSAKQQILLDKWSWRQTAKNQHPRGANYWGREHN